MDIERITKFLIQLRKENNLSQNDLSEKLYISREAISKWERGVNLPDTQTLIMLSELYNVTINEILYGERINEKNKKAINNTTIKVIDEYKNKVKKTIRISITILTIFLLLFLGTYFINNYKSIKVYVIAGSGKYFDISQGMLITSPSKTYLQLGEIVKLKDEEIKSITLYYLKDNNKNILIENDDPLTFAPNLSTELTDKKIIKNITNNLYVDVTSENYNETIKLQLELDFQNESLVKKSNINDTENNIQSRNLDEPILSKFKEVNGEYIYQGEKYDYIYNLTTKLIFITKENLNIGTFDIENQKIRMNDGTEFYLSNLKTNSINYKYYEKDINIIIEELY